MKDSAPVEPRHVLVYDRTWARQVLASGGRPLRWRCVSCGQRFPNQRPAKEACAGPDVVELPGDALLAIREGRWPPR